jgi:hypothetical protein
MSSRSLDKQHQQLNVAVGSSSPPPPSLPPTEHDLNLREIQLQKLSIQNEMDGLNVKAEALESEREQLNLKAI